MVTSIDVEKAFDKKHPLMIKKKSSTEMESIRYFLIT